MLTGRSGIRVELRPTGAVDGTVISFSRCNEFPPRINVYVDGRKVQPELDPLQLVETRPQGSRRYPVVEDDKAIEARARLHAQVGEMLERVPAGDVELIEVFRGVSQLPAEFNDGNCGAIVIWTRQGGRG